MDRVRAFDLRFEAEEEGRFKAALEPELLRQTFIACLISLCATAWYGVGVGLRVAAPGLGEEVRWKILICQQTLLGSVPLALAALAFLRLRRNFCPRVDLERLAAGALAYGAAVVVVGQEDHLMWFFGEDPALVWQECCSSCLHLWGLLCLNIITTVACFIMSIRSVFSWIVPCTGIVTHSLVTLFSGQEVHFDHVSTFIVLVAFSYAQWRWAAFVEAHLRSEWRAVQQVEEQKLSIQSREQELHEKELEMERAKSMSLSVQRISRAFCDTVVTLDEDLRLKHTDRSHRDFFELEVEGTRFTNLLHIEDEARFLACVSRASVSQLLESLPVTLRRKYTTSEVTILLMNCGSAPTEYVLGIRVERDQPPLLYNAKADRKQHISPDADDVGPSVSTSNRGKDPQATSSSASSDHFANVKSGTSEVRDAVLAKLGTSDARDAVLAKLGTSEARDAALAALGTSDARDAVLAKLGTSEARDAALAKANAFARADRQEVAGAGSAGQQADDASKSTATWAGPGPSQEEPELPGVVGRTSQDSQAPELPGVVGRTSQDSQASELPGVVGRTSQDSQERAGTSPNRSTRRMKSIDENAMSDFSFTTDHNVKRNTGPRTTSVHARAKTIRMVLRRWYVPRDMDSCCQYHTTLRAGYEALQFLMDEDCQPLFCSLSEQCLNCSCMNAAPKCMVCHYTPPVEALE